MQQLSLSFGIVPQYSQTVTDPYWDEITSDDGDSVGGQPEPQTENKFRVGDRVEMVSELVPGPPLFGRVAGIYDGRTFVKWESVKGESRGGSYINTKYLRLVAHQHTSPCKSVGEQVSNTTDLQPHKNRKSVGEQVSNTTDLQPHKNCSPTHFVEKYWVRRKDHKYYYFRYTWMEGRRMRRRYIGSCNNPKARERVEAVKNAIALGKSPHEIVDILK